MNPTDSTYLENHQRQVYSRSWRLNNEQNQVDKILGYRIRLLTALILGVIAGVCWWIWQPQSKYVGKFYLLLAPLTESENEVEIATQAELLRSSRVLTPILEQLSLQDLDLNYPTKSPLTIKRLEHTKIVEISYDNQDPLKIELVLKEIANGYINYGSESHQTHFNQQSAIIEKEISQIHQRVSESQKQLDIFRSSYPLYNPEQQIKILSEQLANLEMESYQTQIQLQETTTLYQTLKQQLNVTPEQAIASSDLSESPYYQNLVKQLQEVEIELAQESTIFLEASPNIQALKEKQKNLQDLIKKEEIKLPKNEEGQLQINSNPNALRLSLNQQYIQAANNIQVLESRKIALAQQIKTLKSQFEKRLILAHNYAELQQKINRETTKLNHYLANQEQLKNETTQSLPWQILSKPQLSEYSTSPEPQKNLVLGLLSGLSLGLILSVFVETLFVPLPYKKN
jgi:succinoglycan biosynthesis transport protein ExoP